MNPSLELSCRHPGDSYPFHGGPGLSMLNSYLFFLAVTACWRKTVSDIQATGHLIRHQHRHSHGVQQAASDIAKKLLATAGLGEGSHNQEIDPVIGTATQE